MDATAHTPMISAMNFGPRLSLYSLTATASVVALPETTGAFSMLSCGSCAQEHPGVIFLQTMDTGTVFFVRFRRLAKTGFWTRPAFEWIMIDASHIKVHQHGMGALRGTEDAWRTKGGINTKLRAAVDAHGMPVRFLITAGNEAYCT